MLRRYGLITLFAGTVFAVLIAGLSGSGRVTARVLEIVLPSAFGTALFIALSAFLAILVHELGHVVAGMLTGFRFQTMRVGPLELRRQSGALQLVFVENPHLSGFARLVPGSTDRLVARMFWLFAGGPLASLLYVGFTYLLLQALPEPARGPELTGAIPHFAALSLFVMALSVLPGTLLPFTSAAGTPTDMKVMLILLGRGATRERLVALVLIGRELQSGVRARDWDPILVAAAVELRDGTAEELRAQTVAYFYEYDVGNLDGAMAHLDRGLNVAEALGKKAGVMLEVMRLESSFFHAWVRNDLASALSFRVQVEAVPEAAQGTAALADASIALRQGEGDRSLTLLEQAEAKMEEAVARHGGAIEFEHDRINDLRNAVRNLSHDGEAG
ncbi:M50 family metallopeptidase [Fimbriimonas ginsengisoli]|uniref:Cytolysin immunity CylI domain protein n=1 Tax=Fimbriimonas ginsengisoli Gsoil 348 TaxID=661478 RepID=A0A068NUT6_FIMGI|nr:M50 family metallopeptidase [Fimbriimonas ginsengisoli]AIE87206.1 Cytolysin immunity CylI domain protein [Fimbriimonas ginsengisoli Gsoil 348]